VTVVAVKSVGAAHCVSSLISPRPLDVAGYGGEPRERQKL
jgi:hypothetical protein